MTRHSPIKLKRSQSSPTPLSLEKACVAPSQPNSYCSGNAPVMASSPSWARAGRLMKQMKRACPHPLTGSAQTQASSASLQWNAGQELAIPRRNAATLPSNNSM